MRDQQIDPLNDELSREIEQVLGIEPSSEFQARVRQRVTQEPLLVRGWWHSFGMPAAALALIVAAAVAGWQMIQSGGRRDTARTAAGDQRRLAPAASGLEERVVRENTGSTGGSPGPAVNAGRVAGADRARVATRPVKGSRALVLPPVVVAADEIEGMRSLIALAQAGEFRMVVVSEAPPGESPASVTPPAAAGPQPAAIQMGTSSTAQPSAPGDDANRSERTTTPEQPAGARSPQMALLTVRPLVIEPVTITPVVPPRPGDGFEGVAE